MLNQSEYNSSEIIAALLKQSINDTKIFISIKDTVFAKESNGILSFPGYSNCVRANNYSIYEMIYETIYEKLRLTELSYLKVC
jgi:hypothetical protein